MRKRILALLLAFVFLASAALTPVSADEEIDRILNQINVTFAKAKQLSGRTSFRDWCTEYVKYQLIALGITSKGESDIGGNGTQMYYLVNAGTTSTGYKKIKYEGSNCIYDIIADHPGMNVYNILVSWYHGFGNSDAYPGPGHVMFIHAIIDGYIYYSESYPTGDGILEGQPRVSTVEKFYSIYNGYYGHAVGAVIFYGDIPAHVHNYKPHSTVDATCTEAGSEISVCSICGAQDVKSIPALGHDFEDTVVEPTCLENGYTVRVCKRCGAQSDKTDTEPALGHDFGIVRVEPTCTENGSISFVCSSCGESRLKEELPALGHDEQIVVTEPTCTEEGNRSWVCSRCGESRLIETIPANGHDYEIVVVAPGCLKGGSTNFVCSACGNTVVTSPTPALGHNFIDGVCTVCGIPEIVGDVNEDGKINARDGTALMKLIISGGLKRTTNDVNEDGKLNARDVTALMRSLITPAATT